MAGMALDPPSRLPASGDNGVVLKQRGQVSVGVAAVGAKKVLQFTPTGTPGIEAVKRERREADRWGATKGRVARREFGVHVSRA